MTHLLPPTAIGTTRETIEEEPMMPPSAGSPYSITCIINAPGVTIEWTGPDGTALVSTDRITVGASMADGQTTTSTVSFDPVITSDTGRYTCRDASGQSSTTVIVDSESCAGHMCCMNVCIRSPCY